MQMLQFLRSSDFGSCHCVSVLEHVGGTKAGTELGHLAGHGLRVRTWSNVLTMFF